MMARDKSLHLYEEIMLLALRDEKGTIATGFPEQVIAACQTALIVAAIMPAMISTTVNNWPG